MALLQSGADVGSDGTRLAAEPIGSLDMCRQSVLRPYFPAQNCHSLESGDSGRSFRAWPATLPWRRAVSWNNSSSISANWQRSCCAGDPTFALQIRKMVNSSPSRAKALLNSSARRSADSPEAYALTP